MATFSLVWLYLPSNQMSIYRTIGPLVLSLDKFCMIRSRLRQLNLLIFQEFSTGLCPLICVEIVLFFPPKMSSELL